MTDTAWIIYENKILFARATPDDPPFITPVVKLIANIYSVEGDQSLRILRNKIHINYSATDACLGMAKVAAKGLRPNSILKVHEFESLDLSHPISLSENSDKADLAKKLHLQGQTPPEILLSLLDTVPRQGPQFQLARSVSALLMGPNNQLIAASINTNSTHKIQHAEYNLLLNLWNQLEVPPPAGSHLWVSLRPCKMCAGLLSHFSSQTRSQFHVTYLEDDPGRMACTEVKSITIKKYFPGIN